MPHICWKGLKSEKYSSWFVPDHKIHNTRRKVNKTKNRQARTQRLKKQPYPYLSRLLNNLRFWILMYMYHVENNCGHRGRISSFCCQDSYETV